MSNKLVTLIFSYNSLCISYKLNNYLSFNDIRSYIFCNNNHDIIYDILDWLKIENNSVAIVDATNINYTILNMILKSLNTNSIPKFCIFFKNKEILKNKIEIETI